MTELQRQSVLWLSVILTHTLNRSCIFFMIFFQPQCITTKEPVSKCIVPFFQGYYIDLGFMYLIGLVSSLIGLVSSFKKRIQVCFLFCFSPCNETFLFTDDTVCIPLYFQKQPDFLLGNYIFQIEYQCLSHRQGVQNLNQINLTHSTWISILR